MQEEVSVCSIAYDMRKSRHSLIVNDRNCEGLALSTHDFALQNRPLKGGCMGSGLHKLLKRREGLYLYGVLCLSV